MVIRGAPAIGVAAAMGIALGMLHSNGEYDQDFQSIKETIASTRPTAVNLFWALDRMEKVYKRFRHTPQQMKKELINEAIKIDREDVAINRQIGEHGHVLLPQDGTVLTHCNAGALATAGFGTALGVIRAAINQGKKIRVIAGETRPYLQGARLTVWELQQDNIPVQLITDNMVGHIMAKGLVDLVVVGADRIAANGDTANKIGTYSIAVLANHHHIPFYIAAPLSTIDLSCPTGHKIPIEERDKTEVLNFQNQAIARPDTDVMNPAFDITPSHLIAGIITEKGTIEPDYRQNIGQAFKS
jgi:methylthioribose-1-phosphate isomerase